MNRNTLKQVTISGNYLNKFCCEASFSKVLQALFNSININFAKFSFGVPDCYNSKNEKEFN